MNAAAIETLIAKGLSAEDILDVARALEKKKDNTAAERQARYRERRDVPLGEWIDLRKQVFERDEYQCTYCSSNENLVCDHVVPLVQGGLSTIENLTTACRSCNCAKSGQTPEEWLSLDD